MNGRRLCNLDLDFLEIIWLKASEKTWRRRSQAASSSTADDEARRLRSEVKRLAILWECGGEVA